MSLNIVLVHKISCILLFKFALNLMPKLHYLSSFPVHSITTQFLGQYWNFCKWPPITLTSTPNRAAQVMPLRRGGMSTLASFQIWFFLYGQAFQKKRLISKTLPCSWNKFNPNSGKVVSPQEKFHFVSSKFHS